MTIPGYLRFPHVQGDLITFVADDDVWLAPAAGGRAWRFSADRAGASFPRISADGTALAWTSGRDGPPEVYLAGIDGADARRLSYWADQGTRVRGWTPEGDILAVTAAGQPFERHAWAHALPAAQPEAARRLPFGPVADVAMGTAGVALLTAAVTEPAFWKRYRGGRSGRLWVRQAAAPDRGFARLLAGLGGHVTSPMLVGGRLAFLSDHEGTGNLYSCALDGTGLRRHTDHDGWYARNASTDGQRVVYHCAGDVWLLDGLDSGGPRRLEFSLSEPTSRAPRLITADDHIGSLSCDNSGRASAVEVRGTVHWLTHRDGPARVLSAAPGVRARLPVVVGSSGLVAWVTDAEGADAIEVAAADGAAAIEVAAADGAEAIEAKTAGGPAAGTTPRRLAAGAVGWVSGMAAAPDGSTLAVAARDGRLLTVDIASGAVTELAASGNGEVTGLAWSPDSAWLAWSHPGPEPLRRLRMARPADAGAAITDVTDGRFTDTDPVFTADGKYLAFLSVRSFDPVYDAQVFDLSFPYGWRPYLVTLAAATPSPFGPLPEGRQAEDRGRGQPPAPADGERPAEPVAVDADGLASRIVAVPVPESRYASLRAVKGGLAWLRQPVTGSLGEGGAKPGDAAPRPSLEHFDIDAGRCTELAGELDWFEASGDGGVLVVADHAKLSVVPADRKPDPDNPADRVEVDKSRARYLADPAALWRNAYAEAGRFIRHDYWAPDMAGVDWDGVLGAYRPLLGRIASPHEFADLMWEVLGELGSSHAYVTPAGDDGDKPALGLLGADLARDADGRWTVARVLPGESSDPRARSPLAAPGAQVAAGDTLLAVDGEPLGGPGPGPLLIGAAGKPVELTVGPAAGGGTRRAVVVPLAEDRRLRYQDWVAGCRRRVRELSEGRLGYLHVPDMVSGGWADFHRDLHTEMAREGLILDVRGNRGGHTSELVVEKLARRVIGWDLPRGLQPLAYPHDAPRGPMVALADEFAGSDGDIVTAAIKALGLGPVVGARTWGGVIGIDGRHPLVDGTLITVPRYPFWLEGLGWGVENHGVDPDVEVVPSPDDYAAGRDPQLETGVRMALDALAARPAVTAPASLGRPSKRRPPLPPRPV